MARINQIGPGSPGTPQAPQPPDGPGGRTSIGQTPFGGYEIYPGLSPAEQAILQTEIDKGVGDRLRAARSIAPSVRQQTQAELVDLTLLYQQLGNPFSVRRIPFSVLRDMATDPMISFAHFFTKIPLIRADWVILGPDAQLNAAADAALRPVNSTVQSQICGKLLYGYQPMCKRFRLGDLRALYRDPNGEDPEKDLEAWPSNLPALLWERPYALAPEHVLPRWNERGEFTGFYYSIIPLPNPIQIGLANLYGYSVVPGFEITSEFAMWPVNERDDNFGAIYGAPRSRRAYRYFWSYWYRWALADRAFENLADPIKYVYFPTQTDQGFDAEDPSFAAGTPTTQHLRQVALAIGDQMRSGSTLALPGDFVHDEQGKMSGHRAWEAGYIESKANFSAFSESFAYLDALKFRCVTADTIVERFGHPTPIAELEPGNAVWTWNPKRHRFDLHEVQGVMMTMKDQQTYRVTLSTGRSFRATANHPVLMAESLTWRTVDHLCVGDMLFGFQHPGEPGHGSETWVTVDSIAKDSIEDVWDIQVEGTHNFVSNGVILHNSWFVPEQAFISGEKGATGGTGSGGSSRMMGVQLGEVYQQSQQLLAEENDEEINRDMIPQWIAANFPEKAGTPCRKVTRGFGAYDSELMKQIIQLVGQAPGTVLPVDIREMLRQVGMPLMSEKQQKQQEEQIAAEAAAMQPSPMPPQKVGMQGYNAGVEKTQQGFSVYVQPPQRIDLDVAYNESGFLANLPDGVPAYKDAAIKAAMMKLRKMMLDRYKEQITSFIDHIRAQPTLLLANQVVDNTGSQQQQQAAAQGSATPTQPAPVSGLTTAQASGVASTMVGAWRGTQGSPGISLLLGAVLLAIVMRAAKRELKQAHLDVEVDDSTLGLWATQRSSFVLDSVDDTIDSELNTFLSQELQKHTGPEIVAAAAEKRFEDTAITHADRVVYSEVLPAYNFGALSALQDAGVGEVMAHDASDGRNNLTDPECKRTDGLTMSISEALERASEEHPHGTLWFSPLSTDHFSVQRIEKLPAHLNGKPGQVAAYDQDSEILYVSQEVDEDVERECRLVVGEVLTLR